MKTCPNPNCKFTGLPDEAMFCPNCGTALQKEAPVKKMTISECRLVPNVIKKGEKCELRWRGTNVKSIVIDGAGYSTRQDIFLAPAQSREYDIQFIGEDGKKILDKVAVSVQVQRNVEKIAVVNQVPEKTTRIVFVKDELSRINAYDSDTHNLRIFLNEKCVAYTEMRPYYSKEIVVKKGDVIKLVAQKGDWRWDATLFEKTITDKILSKSVYYLSYVKKMFSQEEVNFHVASYA